MSYSEGKSPRATEALFPIRAHQPARLAFFPSLFNRSLAGHGQFRGAYTAARHTSP